jgi:hypothetical protein
MSVTTLTPAVADAIDELRAAFPDSVSTVDDGEGGAFVTVTNVNLGAAYDNPDTWIGFHITFQYPHADVYPHFVRHDLRRRDGQVLGEAISESSFSGEPAQQVSRRSNHLDPSIDTATIKLLKVVEWLRSR